MIIDVEDMPDQYVVSGFKPALSTLIPTGFNDFTEDGLGDLLFGKKCKFCIIKNDERRDTIYHIEETDVELEEINEKSTEDHESY